jgi:soluble lytic murein transglycosylase
MMHMIARIFFLCLMVLPAMADDADDLRAAFRLAGGGDWVGAQEAVAGAGDIAGDVVEWQRLRAGEGDLGDYEAFLARRSDWPGLPLLREKGEVAVARSSTPERVIAYFGAGKPQTAAGALALIRALGPGDAATAEAVRAWSELAFTAEEEDALLGQYADVLKTVHWQRLDLLLRQDRAAEARRMLPRVSDDWRAVAVARLALAAETADAPALVEAVPKAMADDPGLSYARFVWRMRKDRTDDAVAMILDRSTNAERLGDPAAWAERRASLARLLMRTGDARQAYQVASQHWLQDGADYADLEFVAGFIALRKLGDAGAALTHFQRLQAAVVTPISLSRALYWQGRALEALERDTEAEAAYRAAAKHSTAYYGLLAAERLGLPLDAGLLSDTRPADWQGAAFADDSVLAAARLILAAGDRTLAKRFVLHLAEGLDGNELDQLADMALAMDEPHIALLVAKAAAERGVILPRAYFPTPALVPDGLAVSRALALSIARRESEFDVSVISPAGARGLMQVMPGTAKLMSSVTGMAYDAGKLTTDAGYNVAHGAAYLRVLVDEFGPSVALVASGYNAGPGRPRRWITEFGDPRNADVDVVDWVETIPFAETRTYVMRVVESLVIYRAKLKGEAGQVRISAELRG